ncbi:hypothetical protein ACFQZE_02935 [Paenibacillus sp. GCM10027627]|uniref:hypothetical protein n=1 Tax=unclassified Paenibacillus TaxID=185978 RepID=UPI003631D745
MRKPRVIPIVVTIVVSAAALFGGWTVYKQAAVAAPLSDALQNVPGVVKAEKPAISQDKVQVSVELSQEASLKEVYAAIGKKSNEVAAGKQLAVDIKSKEDKRLDGLWQKALFEVAEAMETKTYSDIPKTMDRVVAGQAGVQAKTEMDETNVYITLVSGQDAKFIVLPRTPNKLGVWGNA